MAWPSLVATDALSQEAADVAVYEGLWDRDLETRNRCQDIKIDGGTSTNAAQTTVDSVVWWCPDYIESGDTITVSCRLKHSAATDTAYFRVQDNASTTNGTEDSVAGTDYDRADSVLTAAADWAGTWRTINFQARNGGSGTATITTDLLFANAKFQTT